ncbi:MAG: hypothetical protein ACE5G5_00450 [Candidatus Methylomirabilales bacterium]
MARFCRCGQEFRSVMEEWGCLHCGGACCPTCGYSPEGTAYCPDCAENVFGVYTRPTVVTRPRRISAWWEAAALQPSQSPMVDASVERPR